MYLSSDVLQINGLEFGCSGKFSSLHPDHYFSTTSIKMLKLKLNLIQHALINILNSSF